MIVRKILWISWLIVICLYPAARGDDNSLLENKKELDGIKGQLEETRKKVDSLKNLEGSLQKEISGYSARVSRNQKLVSRTENELTGVRKSLLEKNKSMDQTAASLDNKRQAYESMLLAFYKDRNSKSRFDPWDYKGTLARTKRTRYLAAVSGISTREIIRTGDSLDILSQNISSLQQHGVNLKRLSREKQNRINLDKTLKKKEEASLGVIRRQTNLMQDRLVSLSEVARQMEEIVARLEKAREQRRKAKPVIPRLSGSFARLKGMLSPPIRGKIVSGFGWKTDKITKLKSFSPGIDIKPAASQKIVTACSAGLVVYVGRLRGYDKFIILEHEQGYYSTYAGLSQVSVDLDEMVNTGEKVGLCGEGNVHLEIRKGREHLDPVIWLDLDDF